MEKDQVKKYQEAIKKGDFTYTYLDDIVYENTTNQGRLTMGVISDIHLYPFNPRQVDRTAKAINHFANEGVDLIFIDGDLTQAGREIEYKEWDKVKEKLDLKDSILRMSMGNHELLTRDTKDLFIKYYDQLPDVHYKLNGYHIIKISPDGDLEDSDYTKVEPWLEKHLALAKADTGNLPIFVFFHHPIENTYYSTLTENGYWGNLSKDIFDEYPMVITLSGHNHAPSNHPLAVWQDKYTAVNVPSIYYAEGPTGIGTTTYYEEVSDVYQGLYLEVEGTCVSIRIYDFDSESYVDQVFEIDTARPEGFLYRDGRKDQSLEAKFYDDPLISLESGPDWVELTFKQAYIPKEDVLMDVVDTYKFILRDDKDQLVRQSTQWANWVETPQPETFTIKIQDLDPGQAYKLEIIPVNGFGKEGHSLELDFETQTL